MPKSMPKSKPESKPESDHLNCQFITDRLKVTNLSEVIPSVFTKPDFARQIVNILSPEVVKTIPEDLQNLTSVAEVIKYIDDEVNSASMFIIMSSDSSAIIGLLFLYLDTSDDLNVTLRIGYLIGKDFWGKGIGSELIKGLVTWAEQDGNITKMVGGVEADNPASIRVLEKNGFIVNKTDSVDDVLMLERDFSAS